MQRLLVPVQGALFVQDFEVSAEEIALLPRGGVLLFYILVARTRVFWLCLLVLPRAPSLSPRERAWLVCTPLVGNRISTSQELDAS